MATFKTTDIDYLQEVMSAQSKVKVIPQWIPQTEKQLLCATFLEAVIRFYEDSENLRAFEAWREEKGGNANRPQRSGNAAEAIP